MEYSTEGVTHSKFNGLQHNLDNAGDQHFSYDDLDRLTLANGPYGASGSNATWTYQYDEIGNLTLNSQLSPNPYGYPASGLSSVRPHAVTTAGANSYTYDANGNMLNGAGRTYTWNQENKPLTITQGETITTFVYDGDGGRVKKIVGNTTTRYLSKLYECDNTNCTRFIWAGSTRIATIASNGTINYWHGDHLGSSSVITDATGNKVQTVTYYPYGGTNRNQSQTNPAIDVPYKYTGKELDASTGLYYYEARYYDPTLGRFISADTIVPKPRDPQELNRYSYAGNNPLIYTDPTGHFRLNVSKFLRRSTGPVGSQIVIGAIAVAATYFTAGAASSAFLATFNVAIGPPSLAMATTANIVGGIAGGLVGGGVAGGLQGGNLNSALVGGGYGALSGGSFAGVGTVASNWGVLGQVSANALTGGTLSAIRGGRFENGVLTAGTSSLLMAGWQGAKEWTDASSIASGNTNYSCRGICTAGTRPVEGGMSDQGIFGAIANFGMTPEQTSQYWEPIQLVSKVHDWIGGYFLGIYNDSGYFVPFDTPAANAAYNVFGNFGTMIPAAAYTGAAFTSGTPLTVDLAVGITKHR